jgi:hypothetical protein
MKTRPPDRLDLIPPDMRESLARFGTQAETIVGEFLTTLESAPPPEILYHYTDESGLRGILASGQLWLTDILALNDPSELTHGLTHASQILSVKAADGPPESRLFARDFDGFIRAGKLQRSGEYFSASFSSQGDDLNQWRAYADNARGFALGFDAKLLEELFLNEPGAPILSTFPVSYDDARLMSIDQQLIDQMFPLISLPRGRGLPKDAINGFMGELFSLMAVHALHAGLHFKHEAYRHESEYRFLRVYPPEQPSVRLKHRQRTGASIGYEEFKWVVASISPLRRIVAGPACNFNQAAQFIQDLLPRTPAPPVELSRSLIPYRAS